MNAHYIHVEAVNIDKFIYDTNDLNTIRGGNLLLLDAIDMINNKFDDLDPICTGASKGLFKYKEKNEKISVILAKIRACLAKPPKKYSGLQYASFIVESQPVDEIFKRDKEILQACIRWEQYKNPTIRVPEINSKTDITPCDYNRMLPGTKYIKRNDKEERVSESVFLRRNYGRDAKKSFYEKQLKKLEYLDTSFVNSFEELTERKNGPLANKMAVIYADGNRFSKIQNTFCTSPKKLTKFDLTIKNYRKEALTKLIDQMSNDKDFQNNGKLRLETLLWGGDEFMWVVPAWKGFETLKLFYDESSNWHFQVEEEDIMLKHGAGIVFCSYKAPIHAITKLCKYIAEAAKEKAKNECKGVKSKNLFQYIILESFDNIGQSLSTYRKKQFPCPARLSLDGNKISDLETIFKQIKQHVSRRQIHEIAEIVINNNFSDEMYQKFIERILQTASPEAQKAIINLQQSGLLGESSALNSKGLNQLPGIWIHVRELWDYIVPDESNIIERTENV